MKPTVVLVLLPLATGCAAQQLALSSAGPMHCPSERIKVTDVAFDRGLHTWNAECDGRVYSCFDAQDTRCDLVAHSGTAPTEAPTLDVKYDEFRDITAAILDVVPAVEDGPVDSFTLSAIGAWHGRECCTERDDSVLLTFTSTSKDWVFLRSRELDFVAGEERVNLGETKHDGRVRSGFVSENLSLEVSLETLAKLGDSGDVKGRLGRVQFRLDEGTRAGLRKFVALFSRSADATAN